MVTTPKPTATRQFAGLALTTVAKEQLEPLKALLARVAHETDAAMQGQPPLEPLLAFSRLQTVHYARFVLLEQDSQFAPLREPLLVFSTNFDGPEGEDRCSARRALEHHLDDLEQHCADGLGQIFACCQGFRPGKLRHFLRQAQRPASTFYVGTSGRSLNQIRWEAELRRRVDHILDRSDFRNTAAEAVRTAVLEQLAPEYATLPTFPAQPDLSRRVTLLRTAVAALALGIGALIVLLGGLPGIAMSLLLGGLAVWRFRRLEQTDPQFQPVYSSATLHNFRVASSQENRFLQNQLTHLVRIKPGPLRWLILRVVFAALQFLAKNQFNHGKLGDIPSIHFARWVLLPNRDLLFLSNFDSSWQSYLGDFIDQASNGLTAVWSNTEEYPRTTWLVQAGSRDAARFLAWTRHNQRPTQVWYSAYPGLSVVNINENTEIHRGLADPSAIDAVTWLFRLRSVDRLATDQLYSEERTREPPLPMQDIQGIILWGYGHLPQARYLLLRVARLGPGLLGWLSALPLASAAAESKTDEPPEPLLNLAFSYRGLSALGVDEALLERFSTPFVQGSDDEYRARVNGDVGADAPEHWAWGGPDNPVHLVLLVFGRTPQSVAEHARRFLAQAHDHGLELVADLEGTTLNERKEHFGFRDGIAQPLVEGSGRGEIEGNTVAAGEFLLGHQDGYGNVSHSPVTSGGFAFGINGSYLVFRQLEQDVVGFWRHLASQPGGDPVLLASKMVGRWPSGAPLVRHPERDPESPRFSDEDAFTYLANDEDNDRYGARCPFGAHIRRANPRDWQLGMNPADSLELSNLHRILRRGRPYGAPLDASMTPSALLQAALATAPGTPAARGLQFLCFNTNIDRQFEFVQQQWLNNPKFAGQNSDADPLLGLHRPLNELGVDPATFTQQSDVKTGLCPRATQLQQFVRVRGSAYFFMPSIPAVRLLSGDVRRLSVADRLETVPRDEQLRIESLITTLREKMKLDYAGGQTLRDAHPKMHGLVQARFEVEPNLPPPLRVGVFAASASFQAYVRFSNAAGTVGPDSKRDIRGVAIKLLGVPGAKLLEGAEQCSTHDFLLVSQDSFVTRDVAEFDSLVTAMVAGKASLLGFLTTHPRVAFKLLQSLKKHSNLLNIEYFGMVPYLLGDHAVKYCLRPVPSEACRVSVGSSEHHLRDALALALAGGAARFELLLQLQTDPKRTPIEDASVAWSERIAPFQKVGTLEIPAQAFDNQERRELGERLSFNPWRCLPEHRPLGGISRARRQVYRALSSFRHDRNAERNEEPSGTKSRADSDR